MATERYLAATTVEENIQPKLEENNLSLLHMKEPLGNWNEWAVLTYDHNVLGNLLIRENKLLQKKIGLYEKKLKMVTAVYPGWPPLIASRSDVVDLDSVISSQEPQQHN